jgi:hypothetical protein
MRLSLLTEQPYAAMFATIGIVFAILTVIVYNYSAATGSRPGKLADQPGFLILRLAGVSVSRRSAPVRALNSAL